MANKKTLKGYFETGDIPNQSQYHKLINSNLNLNCIDIRPWTVPKPATKLQN